MITCPCCSRQLLRHIRQNQIHWFCRSCWQSMPNLNQGVSVTSQIPPITHGRSMPTVMVQHLTLKLFAVDAV